MIQSESCAAAVDDVLLLPSLPATVEATIDLLVVLPASLLTMEAT